MKKVILIIVVFVSVCLGSYYYYYRFVEKITDRYLVQYTPPVEQFDSKYNIYKSTPKAEVKQIFYDNDSVARVKEKSNYNTYNKKAKELLDEATNSVLRDKHNMEYRLKFNLCNQIFLEEWYIICVYHTRNEDISFVPDDITEEAISYDKAESYFDKKGTYVYVYDLLGK